MINKIKNIYNQHSEIIKYLIFGFLTTAVSLIIYYLLTFTILSPNKVFDLQLANIISWIVSVTFAYVTNRKYVFESENDNIIKEGFKFFSSRVVTLLMDMLIMFVSVTVLGLNDKIFKLISQVIVIISNYIFSKLFVF